LNSLYVIGGHQHDSRSLLAGNGEWNGYQQGRILKVTPETGRIETVFEYVSPPEVCAAEDPAITFQASTLQGNTLYACTQTELMIYDVPAFKQEAYVSLPCFNDVHCVRPTPDGNFLVANAGLEMVMEITTDGQVLKTWNVLGEEPWGRFSPDTDYRGLSTKPHRAHPNYVFYVDDEPWVTRFHQGDTISLNNFEKRIKISNERIHDGVVHDGLIYFTTVNGHLVIANPKTLQVEEDIDLNSMHPEGTLLGWCRSVLVDGDKVWIGFSRIRPTKLRENVTWVVRGFKRVFPTHIACYDLRRRQCVKEFDLEPAGLAAVYSIFPAPEE